MADLNPRTDSFITLLLDVSGRARPSDITDLPSEEAAALLESYRLAHPERLLRVEGGALLVGVAPVAAAPAPEPFAPAPAPEPFAPAPAPAVPAVAPEWVAAPVAGVPVAPEPYPGVAPAAAAAPAVDAFGIPTFEPIAAQPEIYAAPAESVGVPMEPMGMPVEPTGIPAAPETYAPAPQPMGIEPNPEIPSWVYEQPAPAPAPTPGFEPAPAMPTGGDIFAPQAPAPVATIPEPDFEAQLLQDIDEGLDEIPVPAGKKRASVSPVIWIALGVVAIAGIAVGVLMYLGLLFPQPEPAKLNVPKAAPVATSTATATAPAPKKKP